MTYCCHVKPYILKLQFIYRLQAYFNKIREGEIRLNIIRVNMDNLEQEHICCAISNTKGDPAVAAKKAWLKDRFAEGLVFKKLDVRGKVFIEYIPAENAWCPIDADGYMFINCLWVSGQYKGQGYSNLLLKECIEDAKAMKRVGLVILSSDKKRPYLSDPKYLKYKGFIVSDKANPYFELYYLPFDENIKEPKFKDYARAGKIHKKGFVLYYSNQCPHAEKYAIIIEKIARERGLDFTLIRYESKEEAQTATSPLTTYSLFYDGEFVTNEILSDKKFIKFLEEKGI